MLYGARLFSGTANRPLAEGISRYMGVPLINADVRTFRDGEMFVQINENVRGADVFVIQPACPPVNDNLMELLIMIDALKRASVNNVTVVMPYYGYARQDRKVQPRVPITAKLVADLLTTSGAARLLTIDLHVGQIQGFFNIPVDNLFATPVIYKYIKAKNLKNLVVVAPDAGGDSVYVGANGVFSDMALTGFSDSWGWSKLTMDNSDASLSLNSAGVYTLNVAMREDGLRIDRLLLVTDTNYIPTGMGPEAATSTIVTNTIPATTTSHVVQYEYDDLYRLTEADYSGTISATYRYQYDVVGNMKAYTETVSTGSGQTLETDTTRVTRYFDDANRLMTATDFNLGSTSYTYDNNGNLTLIVPPDGEERQHYAFNQRNLMVSHSLSTDGTNLQTQATFGYDGSGNRLQQVDYTSGSAVTTRNANNIQGLAQVLIADDGTTQTANLFGFDLIHQQNIQQNDLLYLLADGLGSVRQELSNDMVEATTSYDPYGNLLSQTGKSDTQYGYTGEQHDRATGLLYLRARYYNPAQHTFMGRDPWRGNVSKPQSMNGWSYVEGNPANLIDPTGKTSYRAAFCSSFRSKLHYAECVRNVYGLEPKVRESIDYTFKFRGDSECWYGPVPYRGKGYLEGRSSIYTLFLGTTRGEEVVYDFATMERQNFEYVGGAAQDGIATSVGQYAGTIGTFFGRSGSFRSLGWGDITNEYKGAFISVSVGAGVGPLGVEIGPSAGAGGTLFFSPTDLSMYGQAVYFSGGGAVDPVPGLDFAGSITNYTPVGSVTSYKTMGPFKAPYGGGTYVEYAQIQKDITMGVNSPWQSSVPIAGGQDMDFSSIQKTIRDLALSKVISGEVYIFNQIYWHSFEIKG